MKSIILTVPCQGTTHRILWPERGPARLLNHDPRLYRMEKRLAQACGDLEPGRVMASGRTEPPVHGCLVALAALRARFAYQLALPTWLYEADRLNVGILLGQWSAARVARLERRTRAREMVARPMPVTFHPNPEGY